MTPPPNRSDDAERLRALLSSVPGLLYVALPRLDRPVVYVSEGVLSLTGHAGETIEEMASLSTLIHPADRERVEREVERALSSSGDLDLQYRLRATEKGERWVWDRARVIETEGGGRQIRGSLLDVTLLHHLEGRTRTAQRREAVGRITAGVAHQFNNLLTAILGSLELALREVPSHAPLREELREAHGAGQEAADLVRQLLAFTRPSAWSPELVELNDVLRNVEPVLRRVLEPRVRLVLVLDPGLPSVHVDPRQIEHVALNLVLNAQDAMPKGGRIVVATGVEEMPSRALRRNDARAPGRYVTVAVTDTGEGIRPEIRDSIFEPFFTTREDRPGLGLATAFGIVEQSGGMIRVDSVPGKGATFTVHLPVAEEAAGAAKAREQPAESHERGGRREPTLLIVEDEESVRRVLVRTLTREGFAVLEAPDGETAIALANSYHERIDLLLCDVMLPGMRGPDVARAITLERPEVRVLFMSGYVHPSELERLGLEGDTSFLPKPFTIEELLATVRQMVVAENPASRPERRRQANEGHA